MSNERLLSDIREFLVDTGMGPVYFGRVAAGNARLVERLERGGRVWPDTEMKVRAFMIANDRRRRASRHARSTTTSPNT